jgi:hypothetical protein
MLRPAVKSYGSKEIREILGPAETQYAACNTTQVAGGDTPETRTIQMGVASGTFKFDYETYSIKDQMLVKYQGATLFDTGCVGTNGKQTTNINFSGTSTLVTVEVNPNCGGPAAGTAWEFTVFCPPARR